MPIEKTPVDRLFDVPLMTEEEKRARANAMYALYTDPVNPMSLGDVGRAYEGLSRERVRQIFREHGLPIRSSYGTMRIKRETRKRQRDA